MLRQKLRGVDKEATINSKRELASSRRDIQTAKNNGFQTFHVIVNMCHVMAYEFELGSNSKSLN